MDSHFGGIDVVFMEEGGNSWVFFCREYSGFNGFSKASPKAFFNVVMKDDRSGSSRVFGEVDCG